MSKLPHHRSAVHHTLRNPWLEGPAIVPGHGFGPGPGPGSRPGSRSSGSTTYEGYIPVDDRYAPEPPPLWRHHHNVPSVSEQAAKAPHYDVPEAGARGAGGGGPGEMPTVQPSAVPPSRRVGPGQCSRLSYAASSERPMTPSAQGCGGGVCCDTLDTWCYYCVQAVLGVAALAGLSLLIAAAVLRGQPARAAAAAATANLSALPYIGAMLAAVSSALLLVQKCARIDKKRKKRRLQQQQQQRSAIVAGGTLRRQGGGCVGGGDMIPLQEMNKVAPPPAVCAPRAPPTLLAQPHHMHQLQPLITRPGGVMVQPPIRSRDTPLLLNGTPWWRRQPSHPGRMVYPS